MVDKRGALTGAPLFIVHCRNRCYVAGQSLNLSFIRPQFVISVVGPHAQEPSGLITSLVPLASSVNTEQSWTSIVPLIDEGSGTICKYEQLSDEPDVK